MNIQSNTSFWIYMWNIQNNTSFRIYICNIQNNTSFSIYMCNIQSNTSFSIYMCNIQNNTSFWIYMCNIQSNTSFWIYTCIWSIYIYIYVSQLIRYSKTCGSYKDFLDRGLLPPRKLLNQGFILVKLKSSLRKFYGRHHDLVDRYME
jgi:hypothetical protein